MDSKKVTEKVIEKEPTDIKEDRKQFPLKSENHINTELKRNYQSYIELESRLPDWPSQEELSVHYLFNYYKLFYIFIFLVLQIH